jgi:hypothetical protein
MKKPSSLSQQVLQAQRTIKGWSEAEKASVRLEGSTSISTRTSNLNNAATKLKAQLVK